MADNNQPQAQQPQQDELVRGVVGCFRTINGNKTRIVYTGLFTGNLHVKRGGLFFNFPWRIRPVIVSLDQQKVDTPVRKTHTASTGTTTGPTISYDTDYYLRVINPETFIASIESMGAANLRKTIGDLLDQAIRDYIITKDYNTLMASPSINFGTEINRARTGATTSLADQIRANYGVEVCDIMFRVKPPQSLVDEAERLMQARHAQDTARAEAEKNRIAAQGAAEVTRIEADAERARIELEGAALAKNMENWIAAGMTNDQIAAKLANEALTNGTNPNTVVVASAQATANVAGANPSFDMATMMAMFNAMMNQQQTKTSSATQPVTTNSSSATQPVTTNSSSGAATPVDWSSLDDDQYLTAEDSAKLAAEKGATIQPGGRYHISLLTAEEKTRYVVASAKGKRI